MRKTTTIGKRKMVKVAVYLPVETAQVLENLKKDLGVSYSKIIEKALKKYFEEEENKGLIPKP